MGLAGTIGPTFGKSAFGKSNFGKSALGMSNFGRSSFGMSNFGMSNFWFGNTGKSTFGFGNTGKFGLFGKLIWGCGGLKAIGLSSSRSRATNQIFKTIRPITSIPPKMPPMILVLPFLV